MMYKDIKDKRRKGDGKVPFLALFPSIEEMLNRGYTVKTIHEKFYEKLNGLGYRQFLRYVNQYLRPSSPMNNISDTKGNKPDRDHKRAEENFSSARSTPEKKTGFVMNLDPERKFE